MADSRVQKLAEVLVRYSLRVKKGDWVHIMGASLADELMRALMKEGVKAGKKAVPKIEAALT